MKDGDHAGFGLVETLGRQTRQTDCLCEAIGVVHRFWHNRHGPSTGHDVRAVINRGDIRHGWFLSGGANGEDGLSIPKADALDAQTALQKLAYLHSVRFAFDPYALLRELVRLDPVEPD